MACIWKSYGSVSGTTEIKHSPDSPGNCHVLQEINWEFSDETWISDPIWEPICWLLQGKEKISRILSNMVEGSDDNNGDLTEIIKRKL